MLLTHPTLSSLFVAANRPSGLPTTSMVPGSRHSREPRTSALDSSRWAADHAGQLAEQTTDVTPIRQLWPLGLRHSSDRRSREWNTAGR